MVDYMCPSRPPGVDVDLDLSTFYTNYFPTLTSSRVALVEGYNTFFEVLHSDFGEAEYSHITFGSNQMIIAAFAISGTVAVVGAAFCVFLALVLLKAFRI